MENIHDPLEESRKKEDQSTSTLDSETYISKKGKQQRNRRAFFPQDSSRATCRKTIYTVDVDAFAISRLCIYFRQLASHNDLPIEPLWYSRAWYGPACDFGPVPTPWPLYGWDCLENPNSMLKSKIKTIHPENKIRRKSIQVRIFRGNSNGTCNPQSKNRGT